MSLPALRPTRKSEPDEARIIDRSQTYEIAKFTNAGALPLPMLNGDKQQKLQILRKIKNALSACSRNLFAGYERTTNSGPR